MKEKFQNLFIGRHGMDDFSKALFWCGIVLFVLSMFIKGFLGSLFSWFGILALVFAFVRAFSRQLMQREMENNAFLMFKAKLMRDNQARKERFAQRKDFVFFKCPGCGTMIRVPRGKGKIHITCRCGYQLYRKT